MYKLKSYATALLLFVMAFTFSSCENNDEPQSAEFTPLLFMFDAVDADGNSLYDASTSEGMALINATRVEYAGNLYTPQNISGRGYQLTFHGLFYFSVLQPGQPCVLYFGELAGDRNSKVTMIVTWPDGAEDLVVFTRDIVTEDGKQKAVDTMTVNGEPHHTMRVRHVIAQ